MIMSMRTGLIARLLALAILIVALPASAQVIDTTISDQPVRITVSPETPGANTQVVIRVEAADIGTAVVSWKLNGEEVLSGYGKGGFTFTTGAQGETTTVALSIAYPGKPLISRTFTFTPSELSLVWEANTYVPPFYKGRSHYSRGAFLRVVAFPEVRGVDGALVPDSNLVFAWRRDGEFVAEASGRGKSAFAFFGNQVNEGEALSVTVSDLSGTPRASSEIFIPAEEPRIIFYERDGFGRIVYERALYDGSSFPGNEATLVAEPYFFSAGTRSDPHLSFAWTLNGDTVTASGAQGLITVRTQSEGTAEFGLEIQNTRTYQILQGATAALMTAFAPTQSSGSLFGL